MHIWIPNKRKKQPPQPDVLFIKPNDPWFIHVDDLKLDEVLAEYNHVTIYKARWRTYQTVCVKRIYVQHCDIIGRELEILSMCAHPSVCQFFGIGQDCDYVYYVFEYMDRGNLEDYITECRYLTREERLDILLSIAIGLQYLSSRQPLYIIHRDFKPSNILINKHGEAKISDFGISKYLNNNNKKKSLEMISAGSLQKLYELSQNNAMDIVGTVRWSAPEVLCDNRYNHLCDIFSFGLVAHYVWTLGDIPYNKEYSNNGAKITFAKSQNIRPFLDNIDTQNNIHDKQIYSLIRACTETDIHLRPQSAESIVRTILQIKNNSDLET